MSAPVAMGTPADATEPALARLSVVNRFLPLWILGAMALGLALGRLIPDLNDWLDAVKIGSISLPIAIGLLVMMYPVLAKVRYSKIGEVTGDRTLLVTSLVLNWLVGPLLMFALAWLLPAGPARVPDRADHHRPRPVHRHGAHLERPRLRRPGGRRRPRGDQLRLPDRRLFDPRLLLPRPAAQRGWASRPPPWRSRPGTSP